MDAEKLFVQFFSAIKAPEPITPAKLSEYLLNPAAYNVVLRFFHPRIVQKSYGKEKRFFCPAAIILVGGPGWKRYTDQLMELVQMTREQLKRRLEESVIKQDHGTANELRNVLTHVSDSLLQWTCSLNLNDGQEQLTSTIPFIAFETVPHYELAAKSLFINNADKRKYFRMRLEFVAYLGQTTPIKYLGGFDSSPVHVISKPPKKQSTRTSDAGHVCLKSGMKIALFNRLRAQTFSTRYLYVQGASFVGSSDHWSCFYIYAVAQDVDNDDEEFTTQNGFIHYGSVVRIVDSSTGVSTPNLIVRKIEKEMIKVDIIVSEPVAQLHRIGFQIAGSESSYWSISVSQIIQREVNVLGPGLHEAHDSIAWIAAEADVYEFKFFQATGPTLNPVSPVPLVWDIMLEGTSEHNAIVELRGRSLGEHLEVWFGLVPSTIISANDGFMRCQVPYITTVLSHPNNNVGCTEYNQSESKVAVPITLIRKDGVVYPTDAKFVYNINFAGGVGDVTMIPIYDKQLMQFNRSVNEMRKRNEDEQEMVENLEDDPFE
uniref:Uncharacterized protein n=1 Tax=Panagrolaimus sp. JU765 TaxID=591449 RepID=A0AC34QNB1_9BILA